MRNLLLYPILTVLLFTFCSYNKSSINRFALVNRHNISHSKIDSLSPLTVGNGEFAFTTDITGLQSFPAFYEKGIPLGTQSQWGWHSFPNPENYSLNDVYKKFKVGADSVPYAWQYSQGDEKRKYEATKWLRENPHRLHLGLIGLEIYKKDSSLYALSDITHPVQKLDLWKGEIDSRFEIEGEPVEVITYCHQNLDMITVRIVSDLLKSGKIKIKIHFSYGTHEKYSPGYNLTDTDKHTTETEDLSDNGVTFKRKLDETVYYSTFEWKGKAGLKKEKEHVYTICPSKGLTVFEFSGLFSKEKKNNPLPGFQETAENNAKSWEKFWQSGGAVDFSACSDPRAFELERRVVLSQYLTKVQCTGSLPAQETGLTFNSWYGKFHMEMHWWHALHFILWQRGELIEPQLDYYFKIFDKAEQTAKLQGYKGTRWPKMVAPDGRESPSTIGPLLIWQQPHIIYLTEMMYRHQRHDQSFLEKYKKLVFATADFMASYARWDSIKGKYVLGPAVIPAQERFKPETTINSSFELAYWYWALQTAQTWRERLNLKKDAHWQHVIDHLSDLPKKDNRYLFTEDATDSYENPLYLTDHPIILGALGFVPKTDKIDLKIMQNTQAEIKSRWKWETIWGWDIPLAAMNATCLNQPKQAVDFLLMDTPKNTYLMNGHNYQDKDLPLYLPGNGGLLTAIAMMCTYRNEAGKNGFPSDGTWNVKYENLNGVY